MRMANDPSYSAPIHWPLGSTAPSRLNEICALGSSVSPDAIESPSHDFRSPLIVRAGEIWTLGDGDWERGLRFLQWEYKSFFLNTLIVNPEALCYGPKNKQQRKICDLFSLFKNITEFVKTVKKNLKIFILINVSGKNGQTKGKKGYTTVSLTKSRRIQKPFAREPYWYEMSSCTKKCDTSHGPITHDKYF